MSITLHLIWHLPLFQVDRQAHQTDIRLETSLTCHDYFMTLSCSLNFNDATYCIRSLSEPTGRNQRLTPRWETADRPASLSLLAPLVMDALPHGMRACVCALTSHCVECASGVHLEMFACGHRVKIRRPRIRQVDTTPAQNRTEVTCKSFHQKQTFSLQFTCF